MPLQHGTALTPVSHCKFGLHDPSQLVNLGELANSLFTLQQRLAPCIGTHRMT